MKRDKEYLIKLMSRTLIEKGMDEKIVKVLDYDPIMLFNKLIERFELIDKLSSVENASFSNKQEPDVLSQEEVVGVQFGDEHSVNPLADALTYHLIMSSKECMVVSMHNHPSLSLVSATDIRFFLQYGSIRLLVIVTNLGSVSYMVKSKKYDYRKAVELLNQTIQKYNESTDLKGYQEATRFFISNCYKAGIIYEDR